MAESAPTAPPVSGGLRALFPRELLALYASNPFRLLGLSTTASLTEVQKTAAQMLVRHRLGEREVDEYQVREAVQCLSDPRRRLIAEFFWFSLDGTDPTQSVDAAAYQKLMAGDRNGAAQVWVDAATKEPAGARDTALHNLAILYHWHVLTCEMGETPLYRRFPPDKPFQQAYLQVWQAALQAWTHVWATPRVWDAWRQRVVAIDDPRLHLDAVEELHRLLPEILLQINRDLAVQYVHSGHLDLAKQHLDLIMQAGFDSSVSLSLCREALTSLKERLNEVCDTALRQLRHAAAHALQIYQDFMTAIGPETQKLRLLDPQHQLSTEMVWDKIAETIRSAGIAAINHSEHDAQGMAMLHAALELAASPSLRSRLQADLGEIAEPDIEIKLLEAGQRYDGVSPSEPEGARIVDAAVDDIDIKLL